jgi:hypothetical protein
MLTINSVNEKAPERLVRFPKDVTPKTIAVLKPRHGVRLSQHVDSANSLIKSIGNGRIRSRGKILAISIRGCVQIIVIL